MSLKLGPADGMGLSFSAHCSIPFVITAGLGPRHCLFVSENLHSKCVGQQRLPPKKNSYQWVYFWWIKHPMEKIFCKNDCKSKKPVMDWFLVWPGTRSFIVGNAIPGSAQDCTARASYSPLAFQARSPSLLHLHCHCLWT